MHTHISLQIYPKASNLHGKLHFWVQLIKRYNARYIIFFFYNWLYITWQFWSSNYPRVSYVSCTRYIQCTLKAKILYIFSRWFLWLGLCITTKHMGSCKDISQHWSTNLKVGKFHMQFVYFLIVTVHFHHEILNLKPINIFYFCIIVWSFTSLSPSHILSKHRNITLKFYLTNILSQTQKSANNIFHHCSFITFEHIMHLHCPFITISILLGDLKQKF